MMLIDFRERLPVAVDVGSIHMSCDAVFPGLVVTRHVLSACHFFLYHSKKVLAWRWFCTIQKTEEDAWRM